MSTTTLNFKDGTYATCSPLGYTEVNGQKYAVFLDKADKDIYIYRFKKKKGDKYTLFSIKDKDEFRAVCAHLNSLIQ